MSSNTTHCPKGHLLAITPALEGRKVKCPKCQVVFVVPATAQPVEEFVEVESIPEAPPPPPSSPKPRASPSDEEGYVTVESIPEAPAPRRRPRADVEEDGEESDRPVRRGRRRSVDDDDDVDVALPRPKGGKALRRAQLWSVDIGLACYYWKFISISIVMLLLFVLMILGSFEGAGGPGPARRGAAPGAMEGLMAGFGLLLLIIYLIALGAIFVLGIVGGAFIVRVPPKSGARGLAIANLILEGAPLLLFCIGIVGAVLAAGLGVVMVLLAMLSIPAGFVVFMLLLRLLCHYRDDYSTGAEVIHVMVLTLAVWVGTPILMFVAALALVKAPAVGRPVLVAITLGSAVVMIKLLFKILEIISTVRTRLL